MNMRDIYLFIGVIVGGILWGSITALIENNNLLSIIGLAFSCLIMGISMGNALNKETK